MSEMLSLTEEVEVCYAYCAQDILKHVLLQVLFSPAFVALFFASLLTLEGRPKDLVPKLKQVSPTSFYKL